MSGEQEWCAILADGRRCGVGPTEKRDSAEEDVRAWVDDGFDAALFVRDTTDWRPADTVPVRHLITEPHDGHPDSETCPQDTDRLSEALASALHAAETSGGWWGHPECEEFARIVAPAVERIRDEAVAAERERGRAEVEQALAEQRDGIAAAINSAMSDGGSTEFVLALTHAESLARAYRGGER